MKGEGNLDHVKSSLLVGAGPQVLPLHDSPVDRIKPGRSRSLNYPLIATQMEFHDF